MCPRSTRTPRAHSASVAWSICDQGALRRLADPWYARGNRIGCHPCSDQNGCRRGAKVVGQSHLDSRWLRSGLHAWTSGRNSPWRTRSPPASSPNNGGFRSKIPPSCDVCPYSAGTILLGSYGKEFRPWALGENPTWIAGWRATSPRSAPGP